MNELRSTGPDYGNYALFGRYPLYVILKHFYLAYFLIFNYVCSFYLGRSLAYEGGKELIDVRGTYRKGAETVSLRPGKLAVRSSKIDMLNTTKHICI